MIVPRSDTVKITSDNLKYNFYERMPDQAYIQHRAIGTAVDVNHRPGAIRRALILCFPFFVLDLLLFFGNLVASGWIVDSHGIPVRTDFVVFWVAGKLAATQPSLAYDFPA